MPTIIQFRRGSHTYMTSGEGSQLVLLEGEPFLEYPDTGIGTPGSKLKVGDGRSKYCDLPYLLTVDSGGGGGGGEDFSAIISKLISIESNYAIAEQGRVGATNNTIITTTLTSDSSLADIIDRINYVEGNYVISEQGKANAASAGIDIGSLGPDSSVNDVVAHLSYLENNYAISEQGKEAKFIVDGGSEGQ